MPQSTQKKLSKDEGKKMILDNFETKLKESYIKGLIGGGEIIANEILDLIKNGKTLEDIKHHCESIIKSSQDGTMEKVSNK